MHTNLAPIVTFYRAKTCLQVTMYTKDWDKEIELVKSMSQAVEKVCIFVDF